MSKSNTQLTKGKHHEETINIYVYTCYNSNNVKPSWAKIDVVASSILGDMVEQVAGDRANVTTIVGPDADAHLYTPNAGDAVAVTEADLIITNGMGFETWSATLIETSGTKATIAVATAGIAAAGRWRN